jgi:hypothetical protein
MLLSCDVGHTFYGATSQGKVHLTVGRENMLKLVDVTGKPPKRKGKPKPNPIDNMDAFLQLKSIILNDKMNPQQELALFFGPQEVKELNQKFPWRVAVDRLRRLIKSVGLESEYRIRKYETDTRGVWAVLVQRTPPMVAAVSDRRRLKRTQDFSAPPAPLATENEKPKAMPPKRRRAAG